MRLKLCERTRDSATLTRTSGDSSLTTPMASPPSAPIRCRFPWGRHADSWLSAASLRISSEVSLSVLALRVPSSTALALSSSFMRLKSWISALSCAISCSASAKILLCRACNQIVLFQGQPPRQCRGILKSPTSAVAPAGCTFILSSISVHGAQFGTSSSYPPVKGRPQWCGQILLVPLAGAGWIKTGWHTSASSFVTGDLRSILLGNVVCERLCHMKVPHFDCQLHSIAKKTCLYTKVFEHKCEDIT